MPQSIVTAVEQCAFNSKYPDSVSYKVYVQDEEKSIFSRGFSPKEGDTITYETAATNDGRTYLRIVLPEGTPITLASGAGTTSSGYKPAGGGWQPRKMLPPLTPAEVVDTFAEIASLYSADTRITEALLGFSAEQHQSILTSLFIAATKPRDFYEENESKLEETT
jgi:hypothetical protein